MELTSSASRAHFGAVRAIKCLPAAFLLLAAATTSVTARAAVGITQSSGDFVITTSVYSATIDGKTGRLSKMTVAGSPVIVGSTTFGKGSVQTIRDLTDGSRLKLTIQEYQLPGGVSIHRNPITSRRTARFWPPEVACHEGS